RPFFLHTSVRGISQLNQYITHLQNYVALFPLFSFSQTDKIAVWKGIRTMGWFGLEGTLKISHCHGHFPLPKAAPSPSQCGLECFQQCGVHSLPGQVFFL
uniref:Uncharacterized protein n=1 Tax=Cyanistes caeruleus TaxID=156563 RepID=A0A8C0V9Y2_CYACU